MVLDLSLVDFKYSKVDLLVVPVSKNAKIHSNSSILSLIDMANSLGNFKAEKDEMVTLFYPDGFLIKRVVFLGLGNQDTIDLEILRKIGGKTVDYCTLNKIMACTFVVPLATKLKMEEAEMFTSIAEGFFLASDVFNDYKTDKTKFSISKIILAISNERQFKFASLISNCKIVCDATILARHWTNTPSNRKKPNLFTKMIQDCIETRDVKLSVNILEEDLLCDKKMNALLAVGEGSIAESCLMTLEYAASKYMRTILLVGKGVTFDSGGINLKPSSGLEEMKTDMSGAAVVAATLISIAELQLPNIRVIGVLPLAENMLSGNAMRPGDIISSFLGKSIELSNMDAEGRLLLADAIAWGVESYKPDFVIDVATLTGACVVALGEKIAGLFSTNDYLSDLILESGEKTFERCWRLPIVEDYRKFLKSDLADLKNSSSSKWGGAITAAIFLSEFTDQKAWAHIDIAGPARSNKKTAYCPSGATGFGVRLLCELIKRLSL